VYVLDHLFKDNALMSFQQLQELFDIPKSHFFGYLQIRHFISSLANHSPTASHLDDPKTFLLNRKSLKHFISAFYSLLLSFDTYELPNISRKWESDLGTEFIEDDWKEAIDVIRSASTCNRPVLILAAILDLVLVLVFRRKCILVLVTFSHFYPA